MTDTVTWRSKSYTLDNGCSNDVVAEAWKENDPDAPGAAAGWIQSPLLEGAWGANVSGVAYGTFWCLVSRDLLIDIWQNGKELAAATDELRSLLTDSMHPEIRAGYNHAIWTLEGIMGQRQSPKGSKT